MLTSFVVLEVVYRDTPSSQGERASETRLIVSNLAWMVYLPQSDIK